MIDPAYVRKNFPPVRPEWLDSVTEDVLDPQLPVVDTHHHLWALPESTYLTPELLADLGSGHEVLATVFVDCHSHYRADGPEALRPVGETEFVVSRTEDAASDAVGACAAIVGWADLMLGAAVQPVLEQHVEVGRGRFRGVRTRSAWHEHQDVHPAGLTQPGMLADLRLQEGARRLGAMGLTLDVWVYHTQLAEVAQLADACPAATIVLDHCGCPLGVGPYEHRREEVFRDWREQLLAVAQRPNIVLKVGGLAMPRMGFAFHEQTMPPGSAQLAQAWQPYFETCIEAFGPARCMFESNFPVDKGAVGYRVLWNAFKRLAAQYTASEKLDLFVRTAARTYQIKDRLHAA